MEVERVNTWPNVTLGSKISGVMGTVLDTRITDNSFTGMGNGAAMTGLRRVVEGMNIRCTPSSICGPDGVEQQFGPEHS
ncbi:unnamed protein product [Sphenostylis stenocarpa]|uniref:Uncharacterized protein n=1 Tax=Sphenostylis stenocarpa TaxID=92480 RepID=A0AA86W2G0_9FABA|nr:unnamed protein product [Sphenostylis stenocarpa]